MEKYDLDQAESVLQLSAFEGTRYKRGHGIFRRIISRTVLPLLGYLGKKLYSTGINIYDDIKEGKDFRDSLKNRGLNRMQDLANDEIRRMRQTRSGIKRKKQKSKLQALKTKKRRFKAKRTFRRSKAIKRKVKIKRKKKRSVSA